MTLYLFAAWLLAVLFATVVGEWHGGLLSVVLPGAAIVLGIVIAIGLRALPAFVTRKDSLVSTTSLLEWASELCQSVSASSMVLNGPVVAFANQALLQLLGYAGRGDEVVGLPITNLVHPLDQGRLASLIATARTAPNSGSEAQLRFLRADGTLVKGLASASTLSAVEGALLVQISAGPIEPTSPIMANHMAQSILEQLDQAVFQTDQAGRIIYVNRAWERLCGSTKGDGADRMFATRFHPETRDAVQLCINSVAEGRRDHVSCEARLISGQGTVLWVELRAHPILTRDGEIVGVAGTLTEITKRKRFDDTLGVTRRYLNTLLTNVPGMVYRSRFDREWTMEFVSDGCLELTGYEPYELIDNARVSFGSLIHQDDREFVWTQAQAELAQHKPYQVSYRILSATGDLKWVWEQGRGVFASNGELLAVEGFVTEVKSRLGVDGQTQSQFWFEAQTGLTSRTIFETLLSHVLQQTLLTGYPSVLLWIDLDNFWAINERFGRHFGDQVIATLARRFRLLSGPGTTVTRMGGDQFAMLITDLRLGGAAQAVPDLRDVLLAASRFAERISQELSLPISMQGNQCVVTASIGIAVSSNRYPGSEAILEAAQKAAKAAHELGLGRCEFAEE